MYTFTWYLLYKIASPEGDPANCFPGCIINLSVNVIPGYIDTKIRETANIRAR